MPTNRSSTKNPQVNQEEQDDPFGDDEEVPYYEWNDMIKKEGEGEEAVEYFDDSVLEAGSPEDKVSKEDASATYATVPMTCKYITAIGEVTGVYIFELPEKDYPYGVSALPSKGKINYSVMTRFNKNNPVDNRFVDVFVGGQYNWFADQTGLGEWHFRAGGDEEFDREKPSKYLRPWIRYPKDKKTKKPMSLAEHLNLGMNQTLSRTILTSGTVFLVLVAMLIFGGEVIRGFSWILTIGVISGTYSTLYILPAVAVGWDNWKSSHRPPTAAARMVPSASSQARNRKAS